MHEDRAKERAPASESAAQPTAQPDAEGGEDGVAPARDAEGRLRQPKGTSEGGQFAKDDTAVGEAATVADGVVAEPDPAAVAGKQEPDPKAAPRPTVKRVPVRPGHPLAEQGLEYIEATDQRQEDAIRALLNGYERRQRVEAVEKENAELKARLTRSEATDAAQEKWKQTPEYRAAVEEYANIRDSVGQEAASRYWRGIQGDLAKLVDQEFRERWSKVEAEQAEREAAAVDEAGIAWAQEQYEGAKQRFPAIVTGMPEFGGWFENAVLSFNAELEAGRHPDVRTTTQMDAKFHDLLQARIMAEPKIRMLLKDVSDRKQRDTAAAREIKERQQAQAQRAASDAKKEGVAEFKREVAAKRADRPPHPLGALSDAARGTDAVLGGAEAGEDLSGLSAHELKKRLRSGVRDDVRRRFGNA
jgi:hypothetical protein